MASIASVDTSSTLAAQAVQAAQANTATGTGQTQPAASGLPPAPLAQAASINTLNAELVSSQWGIDPASVSGVYGGAADASGGLFAGDSLLPLLTTLNHANAEQALALIGAQTPTPGGGTAAATGAAATGTGTAAYQSQSALAQASSGSSAPMVVDPLWGRTA